MRRLVFLLPFVSTALFAQWVRPQVRVEAADGQEQVFAAPDRPATDGGVIVEFRDPPLCKRTAVSAKAAKAEYEAAFRRFRSDIQSSSNITHEYYELFNGVALSAPAAEVESIRHLPYVKRVVPDMTVHALAATAPANVAKIRADEVWSKLGSRGAGVTVAVIDTGIDYTHPALGGGFGPGHRVIGGYDFVNKDNDPKDDNLHGTHVAGIIAGNSDQLLGVAPEASLLAYKVLNASGSGRTSDVLAGIERAADPNQDGDFSDHADVANLSLGGIGNPDDPQSVAIDNGTAVGVVYCVAAGNSGSSFHTVGSPGCARSAITVGATDINDVLATFSSRGPNIKDAALKPDVLAPGVSVISSIPGGKYAALSGTSMATPHVAGVAALVKSLHREWSAQQIKSAIVDSATVLVQDIMAEGGGRVDAFAAASQTTLADPSSISLGEDHLPLATWGASATLHITNGGTSTAQYTIAAPSNGPVSVTVNPTQVSLDPGASIDVFLGFSGANSQITTAGSLAFGGAINITNTTTNESARVPWAALKAARVLLAYDKAVPLGMYVDRITGLTTEAIPLDTTTEEAFLHGGDYDVLVSWGDLDPSSFQPGGTIHYRDLRVHYLDAQSVADDKTFSLSSSAASHAITLNAMNERGEPLVTQDYNGYASTGRIVLPPGGILKSVLLDAFPARTWHVTDISEKVLLQELNYDFNNSRFYIVQHQPLNGITADATLTAGGSELKRASISASLAPTLTGDQRIVLFVNPIVPTNDQPGTLGLVLHTAAPVFNMTLFLSPDTDPPYSIASSVESITDNVFQFLTPLLRIIDGNIVSASNGTHVAPWSYSGETLVFGSGLQFPRQMMVPSASATKPNLFTDFVGQLGEVRMAERSEAVTTVYGADSSVLTSGSTYPMPLDLGQSGPYTIKVVDSTPLVVGVPRKSTATFAFDTTRSDFSPPSFTTLMLLDGNGAIATHLEPHGSGSVEFGAADFIYGLSGKTYQAIAGEQTKAWYRYSGSQEWQPLALTQLGEDSISGIVYRADLTGVANADNVLVDLKLDIADAAGNTTSFVMGPAFAVGRDSMFGRRGPHR